MKERDIKLSGRPERRLHPRKTYRTEVIFDDEFGEGLFYVYSKDVSMGGLLLASDIPVRLGTLLFLSIHLPPHKRPIRITGEVIRRAGIDNMGVRFVGLSETAQKRLEEFLES